MISFFFKALAIFPYIFLLVLILINKVYYKNIYCPHISKKEIAKKHLQKIINLDISIKLICIKKYEGNSNFLFMTKKQNGHIEYYEVHVSSMRTTQIKYKLNHFVVNLFYNFHKLSKLNSYILFSISINIVSIILFLTIIYKLFSLYLP